jgi:hypothetical protein
MLPMLRNIGAHAKTWQALLPDILARARLRRDQEQLISPEARPVIGVDLLSHGPSAGADGADETALPTD